MIINREDRLSPQEYKKLNKELPEYRKAAVYLKKQIHMKDSRLQKAKKNQEDHHKIQDQLPFSTGKRIAPHHYQEYDLHSKKQMISDTLNREKSYPSHLANPQDNLFKNGSSWSINKKKKKDIKLPSLEKKSLFQAQTLEYEEEHKPKLLKISVDKLIRLRPEDVRKKFESKFKMANSEPLSEQF